MRKVISGCVAAVLVAGGLAVYAVAQDKPKEKVHQPKVMWEYKVVDISTVGQDEREKLMNELGRDGWELVCVSGSPLTPSHYLKRPKP